MKPTPKMLFVIGRGRLGGALLRRAASTGWPVADRLETADLIWLTVPDDAIATVCREHAKAGSFREGHVVVHASGALTAAVLSPAREAGARVASAHPLQTFPDAKRGAAALPGTSFFLEGDAEAVAAVIPFVETLGGIPRHLAKTAPDAKVHYHAAAVMACNHLVALLDASFALMAEAGVNEEDAREGLGVLIRQTVENVLTSGTAAALTGPVRRGDEASVRGHLDALSGDTRELYRHLALRTLAVAKPNLDADQMKRLGEVLTSDS